MPPTTSSKSERSIFALAPLVVLAVLLIGFGATGCAQVNNPWKDSSALVEQEMTTPSAEGFKGHAEFGGATRRDIAPTQVSYENGAVTHWPLWWEDPFEDKGNGYAPVADRDAPDTEFAVNWVDYLHIAYGPGRMFFVNTAGYPISAIVTPPGTLMESDGRIDKNILGYDHDAKRSNAATREPPDVNFITKAKAPTEEAPANPPPEQPSKQ
jgi:hypothetical protein